MAADLLVTSGLLVIFFTVLIGPFKSRFIEHNLELFLFLNGLLALIIAGFAEIPGTETGWRIDIVIEALTAPLRIADVYGIPIGIVQVVLIVGLAIYVWHGPIQKGILRITGLFPVNMTVFLLIVGLGLISSIISAIIASIILVEVICALPLQRDAQVAATVAACFSIGLGAVLTPLGEPLSTIVVTKLAGAPYFASFSYLFELLGIYIIPGIIAFGLVGAVLTGRLNRGAGAVTCEVRRESLREVLTRAARVYLFIVALVLLGDGFKPLILEYVIQVPSAGLYWVNMVSAILDNATLAAAEIGPAMTEAQIQSALMGLLVAGGMLIPGNIPNIIAAGKLRITSKEWVRLGVPLGLPALLAYFIVIFFPAYL